MSAATDTKRDMLATTRAARADCDLLAEHAHSIPTCCGYLILLADALPGMRVIVAVGGYAGVVKPRAMLVEWHGRRYELTKQTNGYHARQVIR